MPSHGAAAVWDESTPTIEPLFIVGADRSGTTLLRLFLDSHAELAIPAESWFLPDLVQRFPLDRRLSETEQREALACVMRHERWVHDWHSTPETYRSLLSTDTPRTLAQLVDAIFRIETAASGAQRWGDKTPEYVLHVDALASLFPGARFVHIVRDGRDVCQSLLRVGWSDRGRTPYQVARYWHKAVHAGHCAAERLGPARFHQLSYEDLVLETRATLERLCAFAGLEFDPKMLQAHERAEAIITPRERAKSVHPKLARMPRPQDVGRWKREGSRWTLALCWGWLPWGLERYGYETPRPPTPVVLLRILSWLQFELHALQQRVHEAGRFVRATGARFRTR